MQGTRVASWWWLLRAIVTSYGLLSLIFIARHKLDAERIILETGRFRSLVTSIPRSIWSVRALWAIHINMWHDSLIHTDLAVLWT